MSSIIEYPVEKSGNEHVDYVIAEKKLVLPDEVVKDIENLPITKIFTEEEKEILKEYSLFFKHFPQSGFVIGETSSSPIFILARLYQEFLNTDEELKRTGTISEELRQHQVDYIQKVIKSFDDFKEEELESENPLVSLDAHFKIQMNELVRFIAWLIDAIDFSCKDPTTCIYMNHWLEEYEKVYPKKKEEGDSHE